jgi:transmembrane sensor
MSPKQQYEQLVRRYLENKASDEELTVFFNLLREGKIQEVLKEALENEEKKALAAAGELHPPSFTSSLTVTDGEHIDGDHIDSGHIGSGHIDTGRINIWRSGKWKALASAAAVIGLLLTVGIRYWVRAPYKAPPAGGTYYSGDIRPGRNHALLTLASGKVIDLDSNSAPQLTLQSNAKLVKNKAGQWVYHSPLGNSPSDNSPAGDSASLVLNTISAPRGGQFSFVLEDGTKVWLNAASSLRFPVAFPGGSREVTLEGEAYFEVASNPRSQFLVNASGLQVQVLGTHFNINAYADESAIRTTLTEGAVQIIKDHTAALLHPGEQASLQPDGTIHTVKDPEVADAAIAWRNGYFSFDADDIQTVMRQISRWYNVDVRYEGPVTKAVFGGDMERDLTLVQVLQVLEKSQVHFRLEGDILTVLP